MNLARMLRVVALAAAALLSAGAVHASSVYYVNVQRASATVLSTYVVADDEVTATAKVPFVVPKAACGAHDGVGVGAIAGKGVNTVAVTVTVTGSQAGRVTTRVRLALSDFARFAPVETQGCTIKTPVMEARDAAATFTLTTHESRSFALDDATVTVRLISTTSTPAPPTGTSI